ncbi:BON domain-containing protein [Pelagibius sp.]|uniref:BON domain-containing protein n=1 Tax=Pelagibius sp. TaxID=1931238 RepID=UPI003B51445E
MSLTGSDRVGAGRATRSLAALAVVAIAGLSVAGCSAWGTAAGAGAVGVTAAQTEKGFRRSVADTEIRLAINDLWFKADEEMFRKVNLQVQEQRVLLSGNVPQPEQRVEAVRLAWQAPGVREVINEIEVNDTSGLNDAARDSWISAQLRTTLVFDREISSINYSIETVNQAIFIMGVAQSEAELNRVVGHAKDIAYVRRVVSYALLKDDPARSS